MPKRAFLFKDSFWQLFFSSSQENGALQRTGVFCNVIIVSWFLIWAIKINDRTKSWFSQKIMFLYNTKKATRHLIKLI